MTQSFGPVESESEKSLLVRLTMPFGKRLLSHTVNFVSIVTDFFDSKEKWTYCEKQNRFLITGKSTESDNEFLRGMQATILSTIGVVAVIGILQVYQYILDWVIPYVVEIPIIGVALALALILPIVAVVPFGVGAFLALSYVEVVDETSKDISHQIEQTKEQYLKGDIDEEELEDRIEMEVNA